MAVESKRRLQYTIDLSETEFSQSDRNKASRRLLNNSRAGPYVDPILLKENALDFKKEISRERTMYMVVRNLMYRIPLIEDEGQESIAHLGIAGSTLDALLKINEFAPAVNLKTIDGVRSIFSEGVGLVSAPGLGLILTPNQIRDISRALNEFDELVLL